jgi:apolipoprotein N-acyltransferase
VLTETSSPPAETGAGAWLRERRNRFALWIAAAEGVFVAIAHDATKWTVLALAAISGLVWLLGRNSRSTLLRQIFWIFAVSQVLALLLVLFAVLFKWLLILGLIAFAVLGLAFLYFDRR